jgi:peptidoglycan/LPS O-acetylase OafA/YrhL
VQKATELKPAIQRLDGVDVLRGLSILAVVLLHILIRFSFSHVRLGLDWPKYTRHFLFLNGGNGVTVFFAVSGFLITLTSCAGSVRSRPCVCVCFIASALRASCRSCCCSWRC